MLYLLLEQLKTIPQYRYLHDEFNPITPARFEDHRGCVVPVSEEALRCDDPHRLLPQRLCPYRATAVYGPFETKMYLESSEHHRERDRR